MLVFASCFYLYLKLYLFIVFIFICTCYLLAFVLVAWPLSIFALLLDSDLSFCAAVFRLCTLYRWFFYIYLNTLLNCTAGSAISKINEQFSYSRTPWWYHLHSISALLCLKTRDLFAVSISKSSLACTIHNCTAACTLLHFCSECLHWSALHCPSLHCFTLHCTSLYYFTLHCPSLHAWLCALCVVFIAALCWPQSRIFLCTVWLFICNTPAMQFLL